MWLFPVHFGIRLDFYIFYEVESNSLMSIKDVYCIIKNMLLNIKMNDFEGEF